MKRACPFDANLLRQTKCHLSDYDIDVNVRKKVKDSTFTKIMEASAKSFEKSNISTINVNLCSYCDIKTDILSNCVKCGDLFCEKCCFKMYSSNGNDATCITCY